ncbi:MAG: PilZ domain-containing protein [Sphingobium sp.]
MEPEAAEIRNEAVSCPRRDGRASLSFPCRIMLSDGNFSCELKDLSLGGARIATSRRLQPGRSLWLKLDDYEAFATVMWVGEGECGIEFEDRLPKVVVMRVQGYSVDLDEYEAAQSQRAARNWVVGEEGRPPKSPLIRLLDVLGPKRRDAFAFCADCDSGEPCQTHCGHKQFRRYRASYRVRAILYLALAAVAGVLIGIGSELIG